MLEQRPEHPSKTTTERAETYFASTGKGGWFAHLSRDPTRERQLEERLPPGDVDEAPNPRFTFDDERTFLA